MQIQSQKINSVALNEITLDQLKEVENPSAVHTIMCIDVSYSMVSELPKLRTQLKNRIPDLVGVNDTISIIWFSGRNQAGILKEGVKVGNAVDLKNLNDAIDRFIKPIGATSFLDPVILTQGIVSRIVTGDSIASFIFLTDGYNNSCPWPDVINALTSLEKKVAVSTFIEYGYYANSEALSEMAETLGGEKVFSKDFDSYEIEFEKKLTQNKSTTKRFSFDLSSVKSKMQYQFLFSITDNGIVVYGAHQKNEILIPEDTEKLYFFSEYAPSEYAKADFAEGVLYAASYVLADKMKYKLVDGILSALGDVNLQEQYANSYGKQRLNAFKENTKSAVFDLAKRFVKGKQVGKPLKPNAYCFMNMIEDLMEDEENKFFPYHPDFNYERIGAKREVKTELSDDQKKKISSAKTLKEVEKLVSEVEVAEFIYPENQAEIGQSFSNLVWNEKRANLSINTQLPGKVKLPKNDAKIEFVDSKIFRSYTFVKDGILNVTEIPVTLSENTYNKMVSHGLLAGKFSSYSKDEVYMLNFSELPIINRRMATTISAKSLAKLEWGLLKEQNRKKYLDLINKTINPKTNEESAAKFTPEFAEWLKSIGVSDSNGFSPKTEKAETTDVYMSSNLETKISSYSSIPAVKDVIAKVNEGKKLNPSDQMLYDVIQEVDKEMSKMDEEESKKWILEEFKTSNKKRRQLLAEIAQIKFGVILSRTWFTEFKDFEENTLDITLDKLPLKFKFEFSDKEVKV